MSKKSAKEVVETKEIKEVKPTVESVELYSFDDLVEAHKAFGYPRECVVAALRFNKITQCGVETAKKVIKKFMERVIL